MPTTHPRHPLALFVAILAALGLAAAPAGARAVKPAGPALTIESKACNTGATVEQRFIVLTASAVLRGDGDEVQMRFTVQQRAAIKTTWRTVFAKTGDLGTWATSDAGADGLRYTKTINGLAEGSQYRVLIDARGIAAGGKVVTKTTRKTVSCIQPQLSAALVLPRAVPVLGNAAKGPLVRATIRNAGKAESAAPVITVRDAATQTQLGQVVTTPLPGRSTVIIPVPVSSCTGQVIVTVQEVGAAPTDVTPDQTLTIDCTQPDPAAAQAPATAG